MTRKLVMCVEGEADKSAVPVLVKRIVTEQKGWDALFLDKLDPLRVGHVHAVGKANYRNWKRYLGVALKRKNVGGVLVVLDGDARTFPAGTQNPFCPVDVAVEMAQIARAELRAGDDFSLAVVFACCEFESWLIAGVASVAGQPLPDGRPGVKHDVSPPDRNLEQFRDAKGWLNRHMSNGYRETLDQAALAAMVDLDLIRQRPEMRSFQRLEKAIGELIEANRTESHISSPRAT